MIFSNKNIILLALVILALSGLACSRPPAPNNQSAQSQSTVMPNEQLNLSGKKLGAVPSYVFDIAELKELDISNNNIGGAIPAEIRKLEQLEVLNASNNIMTGVPAEIGQLKNLRILNLSNNKLTGLPQELGNLKNLKIMDLSGNSPSSYDLSIIQKNLPTTKIIL